jgi:putative hydrolase of the HAD superfamily
MAFQGLFFDAAGTLFKLAEPVGVSYSRWAEAHGLMLEPNALEHSFRRAWKQHPPNLLPVGSASPDDDRSWWRSVVKTTFETAGGTPLPDSVLEPLFVDLYDHFAQPGAWTLFSDVPHALERLSALAPLHILSNFDLRLNPILKGLGIARHFQTVTLSSQVGVSKPHPGIFSHALTKAGIPAHAALHIGDEREADLKGATEAGMFACLLDRPTFDLATLAEKLHSGDDSCLQAPPNGVLTQPQIERG